MKSFLKLIFLPILSVGLFIFVYLNNIQPKLGLDLQGGVSVILTAEEGTDPELIANDPWGAEAGALGHKTA